MNDIYREGGDRRRKHAWQLNRLLIVGGGALGGLLLIVLIVWATGRAAMPEACSTMLATFNTPMAATKITPQQLREVCGEPVAHMVIEQGNKNSRSSREELYYRFTGNTILIVKFHEGALIDWSFRK